MEKYANKVNEAFSLILLGATGDLARNKILPAIYDLNRRGLLPREFSLIGNGRTTHTNESFRDYFYQIVTRANGQVDQQALENLLKRTYYYSGDLNDVNMYSGLKDFLDQLEDEGVPCGNKVFQLAILPHLYANVSTNIAQAGMKETECGWVRILIEKPFGMDLESAKVLNEQLLKNYQEEQIFRIDHYLAKETVQNILALRFANEVFEHLWKNQLIDHIQISVMEELGADGRGKFYERTGALRDVIQNHLLQVLAVTMMERPEDLTAEEVRRKRKQLLNQLKLYDGEKVRSVVRGQYQGYRDLRDTDNNSMVETFVALKMEVDTPRWSGVPVYIRTGKKLKRSVSEISLVFKDSLMSPSANVMTIRLSPNEGIVFRFFVKQPGPKMKLEQTAMQFCYKDLAGDLISSYEKVLLDVFEGERMLFVEAEGIEAQWRFVDPILKYWENLESQPEVYEPGSWGPKSAEKLIEEDGRAWLEPSMDVCPV